MEDAVGDYLEAMEDEADSMAKLRKMAHAAALARVEKAAELLGAHCMDRDAWGERTRRLRDLYDKKRREERLARKASDDAERNLSSWRRRFVAWSTRGELV